jgi:hypothetical protein
MERRCGRYSRNGSHHNLLDVLQTNKALRLLSTPHLALIYLALSTISDQLKELEEQEAREGHSA